VLHEPGPGSALRRLFGPKLRPHGPVSRVMVRHVFQIDQNSTVQEALRLMVDQDIKRLPVVDGDHHYLGMIRRDALLIALSHDL